MRQLLIVTLAVFLFGRANANNPVDPTFQGIRFEETMSWKETLAKAKKEHKYIFVDCYTTWCGPCKKMDKEVYPDQKVGEFYNGKFISVRMQMDTSKTDGPSVRARYGDARYFERRYHVSSYPALIFFTPEGKILNQSFGSMSPGDFITLGTQTIDPARDYYVLLEKFHRGKTNLTETSFLARQAMVIRDTMSSREVSSTYLKGLSKDSLLTKSNIEFMSEFTRTSKDPFFPMFLKFGDSIDREMGSDVYAQEHVQQILYNEIMFPAVNTANADNTIPDWNNLYAVMETKYSTYYAGRVTVAAKCTWASSHKNWPEYTKYLTEFQEYYGSKTNTGQMASLALNNYAWMIFKFSDNKEELKKALGWSGRAVLMAPYFTNWMDTYANLLYKAGQKELAISWEKTILKLDPSKYTEDIIEKMQKNLPTWPSPESLK